MQPFVVYLGSAGHGVQNFDAACDKTFFESFGNTEILDADIKVTASIRDNGRSVDVKCGISGSVTVPCDLCLEPLTIPVQTGFEEIYTPQGRELDLNQDVYDFVCISLPMHKVHPEGECNEETIKYLSK